MATLRLATLCLCPRLLECLREKLPDTSFMCILSRVIQVGVCYRRKLSIVAESVREWDDWHLDDLLTTLITQLEVSQEEFMRQLGLEYLRECRHQYGKALQSLGYNIEGFLTNLTSLCDIIKTNPNLKTKNDVPSLVCNRQGDRIVLHFFTNREPIRYFVGGVIEGVGAEVFYRSVSVTCDKCDTPNGNRSNHRFYFRYTIEEGDCLVVEEESGGITKSTAPSTGSENGRDDDIISSIPHNGSGDVVPQNESNVTSLIDYQDENSRPEADSSPELGNKATSSHNGQTSIVAAIRSRASCNTKDSKIGVSSFCKAFPWHFVCNKAMRIIQLGSGLLQVFGPQPLRQADEVGTCFTLRSPEGTSLTYDQVIARINIAYVLAIKIQPGTRNRMKVQWLT
ncbi:hypothetical protein Pcinc_020738 [Petrolisthes cinctipes]|uniref:guanylate cyclase n=1 Tax=Petrolisthes cinctipes TaxID=88211 RepID=A0AAE1FIT2_PETCI|nr:hypothetical protein Pcinc_020738 [Petrolisthes cinctipes]